jgi:hypothetical protein
MATNIVAHCATFTLSYGQCATSVVNSIHIGTIEMIDVLIHSGLWKRFITWVPNNNVVDREHRMVPQWNGTLQKILRYSSSVVNYVHCLQQRCYYVNHNVRLRNVQHTGVR